MTTTTMTASPMTATRKTTTAAPVSDAAVELLDRAQAGLLEAAMAVHAGDRYVAAHLSALRTAAAVLATRGRPAGRSGPRSAWEILPRVAPELTEWSAFFAAGADRRAALEAGRADTIAVREADDQVRAAETFLLLVESGLGLEHHPVLPGLRPAGP